MVVPKKVSTLFVDMLSPPGHVRLNSFYLAELAGENCKICASDRLAAEYSDFPFVSLGSRIPGSGFIERLLIAFRVIRTVIAQKPSAVCFLSYDLVTFPLISHVLSRQGMKLFAFEHNTASLKGVRWLFHRSTSKSVVRLVYTPYIHKAFLRNRLKSEYVPHPILPVHDMRFDRTEWDALIRQSDIQANGIALCPSGSISIKQIEAVARLHKSILFVCKSNTTPKEQNVITFNDLKYYGSALMCCDFVCIPLDSDTKVSGPAFEAIAMRKRVMVSDNRFGNFLKSLFPENVLYSGAPVPTDVAPPPITGFNDKIVAKIRVIFQEYSI